MRFLYANLLQVSAKSVFFTARMRVCYCAKADFKPQTCGVAPQKYINEV